jgi:hypothetical protein
VSRPAAQLRVCAGLVGLEALALFGAGAFYLIELAVATVDDVGRALVTAALAWVAAVGLALVARGLERRRRWARAPALVTNLILVPVAIGLLQSGRWYVGGPLLLVAIGVVGLLFAPSTSADLEDSADG